jgi:hypothetical protein
MQGSTRHEHRRRDRKGERTLVVRVIEYPAPAEPRPAAESKRS